jgi:hypothetical protein
MLWVVNQKFQAVPKYKMHAQMLITVDSAEHFGLTIHENLSLVTHINKITRKANSTLDFIGRNIS